MNTLKRRGAIGVALVFSAILVSSYFIHQTESADAARRAAARDSAVIERCGEDVVVRAWILAPVRWSSNDDHGYALLHFRCAGSLGSAYVTVNMVQQAGVWSAKQIKIDW
jgi:hypothetical protein